MAEVKELRPGDPELIGAYRVLGRLGCGAQGVVYLAIGPTGERVAVKQLHAGPDDVQAQQRFVTEVTAARLVAPFYTARVVDAQLDGPSPFLASEYIEGPSLQQYVQRYGPMKGIELERLALGTMAALDAIHDAGVVHRDFKPANVMLAENGPRVIDFGIARHLSDEISQSSTILGTPAYMAPEQLGIEPVGPPADVFAWASVIAYAATGRVPFAAAHVMAVVHRITTGQPDLTGIPADLLVVLKSCLNKDPHCRPSAQQALAMLLGRPVRSGTMLPWDVPARAIAPSVAPARTSANRSGPAGPWGTSDSPSRPRHRARAGRGWRCPPLSWGSW